MLEVDVKMGQQLQYVSHHFESEIETAFRHIYETYYDHHDDKANDDLYTIALLFRLLRQQGYPILVVSLICHTFDVLVSIGI
ncbi:hypothetical protein CsSME_00026745 [Camellia sinensis var. sinensis]